MIALNIKMNYTQKKKQLSNILKTGPLEFPLSKDIKNFIEEYMVNHHVGVDSLKIDKIWIQKNKGFKHNNFYFHGEINGKKVTNQLLGTSSTISDKNKAKDASSKRLTQGMREAISWDLFEYKKIMVNDYKVDKCQLCSVEFDNNDLESIHVDHVGPKEFRHIKEEFLSAKPNLIAIERGSNDASLTKLVDNEDKQLWIEFHHNSCNLQLICKKCNLGKSKK